MVHLQATAPVRTPPLDGAGQLPLVVAPVSAGTPIAHAHALRPAIDAALRDLGGVLFRGYAVADPDDFRGFARGFGHPLVRDDFAPAPRRRAHQHVPLHNARSHTRAWPMTLWLHCQIAAARGGETPIADSRRVYQRIDPAIRRRFDDRGLLYVRNYGNGLDAPWQRAFDTTDPDQVEACCRAHDIAYAWTDEGELCTRQLAQATARHPRTGARVWFNQAHLFHASALEPIVREALLEVVAPDQLPRNAYYGDGAPIEDGVLDEIRGVYRELAVVFAWQAGDVLVLDNMLVAHGRTPFHGERKLIVAMADPYRG